MFPNDPAPRLQGYCLFFIALLHFSSGHHLFRELLHLRLPALNASPVCRVKAHTRHLAACPFSAQRSVFQATAGLISAYTVA